MPHSISHFSTGSEASEAESEYSETSTIEYEHESFETFRTKVEALCKGIWTSPLVKFDVQRGRGGSYNRIVEITVHEPNSPATPKEYILRVPRFEKNRLDRDFAALQYARQHTELPIPENVAIDLTADNPLGGRYVVQTRLPGVALHDVYPTLIHAQKCSIAQQIGHMYASLHTIESPVAGIIEQHSISGFVIRPFDLRGPYHTTRASPASEVDCVAEENTDTISFLLSRCALWKGEILRIDSEDVVGVTYFDRLSDALISMHNLGQLRDNEITLCHLDLAPRNILVSIQPSNTSICISGVLDWDSVVFAPRVMACAPPMWLWNWASGDEEENEAEAGELSLSTDDQEIKSIFEKAVGAKFLQFCYKPQYRVVRSLIHFAIFGMHSNEDLKEVDKALEELERLKPYLADEGAN
ncbi:hypothetical protein G7Y79_00031g065430 [Physcia stellaris]|nr:hypothetical protein G7Y79_00031g065430 [Physcia stellaris]